MQEEEVCAAHVSRRNRNKGAMEISLGLDNYGTTRASVLNKISRLSPMTRLDCHVTQDIHRTTQYFAPNDPMIA